MSPLGTLTKLFGGTLSGTQHRTMTQSFLLDLARPNANAEAVCNNPKNKEEKLLGGIQGDLGIKEIVDSGIRTSQFIYPNYVIECSDASKCKDDPQCKADESKCEELPKLSGNLVPTIGSTIDFTVIAGLNGGPLWSLIDFKGPNGANGLAGVTATWKDTLTFSIASALKLKAKPKIPLSEFLDLPPAEKEKQSEKETIIDSGAAADAAANAVTRQLLQQSIFNNNLTQ